MRHVLSLEDLEPQQLEAVLERAEALRGQRTLTELRGRRIILVFFSPSLRTRVSMQVAAEELGAQVTTLNVGAGMWKLEAEEGVVMNGDKAEHIRDAAKVLARYGDLIAVRAFPVGHSWEEDRRDRIHQGFKSWAGVPILNLESSRYHPCQALADLLTIRRTLGAAPGKVCLHWCDHPKALPVAVPSSFALAAARMGWDVTVARPEGYDLPADTEERCRSWAEETGGSFTATADRAAALDGARVVYAKSWGRLDRYGDTEREIDDRRSLGLAEWIIDDAAMARTDRGRFMHCLPVRRNVVVTDSVLDSEAALVYDEAENRLHAQKGLLSWMLEGAAR